MEFTTELILTFLTVALFFLVLIIGNLHYENKRPDKKLLNDIK